MLRIDLIFPPNRHSWNLVEGWEKMVHRVGFEVRSWRMDRQPPEVLLDYYRRGKNEPDLILAVGGDLHIPHLHQEPAARAVWKGLTCPRVCLSYESLRDSLWPESRGKFLSSLEIFSHYAVCDEVDESWVSSQGRPARWIPQGVDVERFYPRGKKRQEIVFRGKFQEYAQYGPRRRLLEALVAAGLVRVCSREMGETAYRRLYQRSGGILNPRGVFGGYNVRTFEALASGCVLFQQEIPDRPRNATLLRPGVDAVILPQDEQACVRILAATDWRSFSLKRMAQQGSHLAQARHSLEDRLAQILEWIGKDRTQPALLAGARVLREEAENRVIERGNPISSKNRWKKMRRTFYRFWPLGLGLSYRKKMLGLASANSAYGRHPSRLQQDCYVHRKFLGNRRNGVFREEGSRLAAGSPALYLRKFWGWQETDGPRADLLCGRGPDGLAQAIRVSPALLVMDNFRAQPLPKNLQRKFRVVYAENEQEYLIPRK